MIIDAFMYNGEENILDIRLNTLNDIVDFFVILESPKSHSKIPREVEFRKQKERFAKFKNKIIYLVFDYCQYDNFHFNDYFGRDLIHKTILDFGIKNDFILIHGDLDEIPNPNLLKIYLEKGFDKPITFKLDYRMLCFDLQHNSNNGQFPGSIIIKKNQLTEPLHKFRLDRTNTEKFEIVNDAGWHLTYCAGIDRTVDKFKYFCHAGELEHCVKTKDGLINCIKNKVSIDGQKLDPVELKIDNFPEYVYNNQDKFKENFFNFYENL